MPRPHRKKSNNAGSVTYDRNDDLWVVRVMVPSDPADPTSRKRRVAKKRKTKDAAELLLAEMQLKIKAGEYGELLPGSRTQSGFPAAVAAGGPKLPSRPTLAEFYGCWVDAVLPTEVIRGEIREVTRDHYVRVMTNYMIRGEGPSKNAGLGLLPDLRLADLTTDHVDAVLRELVGAVSNGTARHAVVALKKMLGVAAKRGYVSAETVADIKPPAVPRGRHGRSLTEQQAVRVAELVAASDYDGRGAAILQVWCGLRRSEALAVRWSDIDGLTTPRGAHVFVTASVAETDKGLLVFGDAKTAQGRRTVSLPEPGRMALLALRKSRSDTVFVAQASRGVERPVMPRNYSRWLRGIYAEVGAPGNSHAMRHAYAINALRAGVPMATISRALGHSSHAITADIYMDIGDRDMRGAADAIAEVYAMPTPSAPVAAAPTVS